MSASFSASAAVERPPTSPDTTLVALDVPAGVTEIEPGLKTVSDVRLVGNAEHYRLVPGPVQSLIPVSEEDARAELATGRTTGMPFSWAQASSGAVLLSPRFELPLVLEVEGH